MNIQLNLPLDLPTPSTPVSKRSSTPHFDEMHLRLARELLTSSSVKRAQQEYQAGTREIEDDEPSKTQEKPYRKEELALVKLMHLFQKSAIEQLSDLPDFMRTTEVDK